ncbi:MAG: MFS transporter [candidate division KSB1 bacterium]|nr:MFS transporter [candidate division KSB1 bacterium]
MSKRNTPSKTLSPWFWVPSLYFAEGIPYIVVMTVSVIMYKRMGISNADIALYTSWLYLPWVIKPLWSPVVDLLKTKRFWITTMQLVIGAGLASVALSIPVPKFFQLTLAFFWLLAFGSATHDIAADGFYMLGLSQHDQAWFVGVRSTFYRFAMLTGQGLLVILAGYVESHTGLPPVTVPVAAVRSVDASSSALLPDSVIVAPQPGKLEIVQVPAQLSLPLGTTEKSKFNEFITHVRDWNRAQGQKLDLQAKKDSTPSWWQLHVSTPLRQLIKKLFRVAEAQPKTSETVGNLTAVSFHLSSQPPPKKTIVVTFGRESGDKSISLVEGSRFEFTAENWNKPVMAAIQVDPKLKEPTAANFVARAGNVPLSWIITFLFLAGLFLLFAIYHRFILPHPAEDVARKIPSFSAFFKGFAVPFISFFKKEQIGLGIAFLLLYRLAESQLVKLASPFLLDSQEAGGIALTTGQIGFVYGTMGLAMLTVGGLLGGFLAARDGLKKWLWLMVICINVPDLVYVYLSHYQPDNYWIINLCVGIEQLGYGFGFTAYMLYMIYMSEGQYKTAHFAITTGFMALGMMIPGMFSGWLQEMIGYEKFFIWVMICTIPGFILVKFLPIDPEFGKKKGA